MMAWFKLLSIFCLIFLSACGTLANRIEDPYRYDSVDLPYPRNTIYGGVATTIYFIRHEFRSPTTSNMPFPLDIPLSFVADTLILPLTIYEEFSQNPLPAAAEKGNLESVKKLLENGEDPNSTDIWGHTALMSAAWSGRKEVIEVLLSNGAALDVKGPSGMTAFLYAVNKGHTSTVKQLILKGAPVNLPGPSGITPLHFAAGDGNANLVTLLLKNGADTHVRTSSKNGIGNTPLFWAASSGHSEVVRILISRGANVNVSDDLGKTPLLYASCSGNQDLVRILLENGAAPELKARSFPSTPYDSALSCATVNQHAAIVKMLIKAGATE